MAFPASTRERTYILWIVAEVNRLYIANLIIVVTCAMVVTENLPGAADQESDTNRSEEYEVVAGAWRAFISQTSLTIG